MTLDNAELDPEIIDALKGDARTELPPELDQRVASRLAASAGIFGLSTAVTTGSQAAAISAAASVAASPAAASAATAAALPAVKLLTLGSLGKTLALGMALGSTVGLGLHATFRHVDAPRAAPAATVAALAPRAADTAPARRGGGAGLRESVVDEGTSGVPLPEPAPGTQPAEPRTNPSPELPGEVSPSVGVGLGAQQALLDDARAALRRGDGTAALAVIRRHTAEFPSTAFEEERAALAIKALVLVGKVGEARSRTERFEARFPRSLLTPSLRAALGTKPSHAESMTDRASPSQTTSEQ
jgi:hypothetical protein